MIKIKTRFPSYGNKLKYLNKLWIYKNFKCLNLCYRKIEKMTID